MGVLLREWGVGLIKGGTFGLVLGLIAWLWKGSASAGSWRACRLPEHRHRGFFDRGAPADGVEVAGRDPAMIAGVFDTMLSELTGTSSTWASPRCFSSGWCENLAKMILHGAASWHVPAQDPRPTDGPSLVERVLPHVIELARDTDARVDLRTASRYGETESVTACEAYPAASPSASGPGVGTSGRRSGKVTRSARSRSRPYRQVDAGRLRRTAGAAGPDRPSEASAAVVLGERRTPVLVIPRDAPPDRSRNPRSGRRARSAPWPAAVATIARSVRSSTWSAASTTTPIRPGER